MILQHPLAIVATEDGKIGFNQGPTTEQERLLLVGILQRAVMAMSQMPLAKPAIEQASPVASMALAEMLKKGRNR